MHGGLSGTCPGSCHPSYFRAQPLRMDLNEFWPDCSEPKDFSCFLRGQGMLPRNLNRTSNWNAAPGTIILEGPRPWGQPASEFKHSKAPCTSPPSVRGLQTPLSMSAPHPLAPIRKSQPYPVFVFNFEANKNVMDQNRHGGFAPWFPPWLAPLPPRKPEVHVPDSIQALSVLPQVCRHQISVSQKTSSVPAAHAALRGD